MRTLGDIGGPEFKTDIHPWLMHNLDLGADEAHSLRSRVMQEFNERGMVERINTRGNLRILPEYYPAPESEADTKIVDSGLRLVED